MTATDAPPSRTAADDTRRLAQALLPRSSELAAEITKHVMEAVPMIAPPGTDAVAAVAESTEQNVGAVLAMLAFGVVPRAFELPPGTVAVILQTIAAGGDVTTILRAYRAGHRHVWELWSREVRLAYEPAVCAEVLVHSSQEVFAYFDRACERVVEEHQREVRSLHGTPNRTLDRHAGILRLLGDEATDPDAISAALAYEVRDHHLALVVRGLSDQAEARLAFEHLAEAGEASLLVEPVGPDLWWGWLGWRSEPSEEQLARVGAGDTRGTLVALGEPGVGRDGFRRSHGQARDAERTVRLRGTVTPGCVRYREVELAALLCIDPGRAGDLAAKRLGALAARDDTCARLRMTLRSFLACGRNKTLVAQELRVHHKTVAYRIAQAEAMLERSVAQDAVDLEIALIIDEALHGG